MVNDRSTLVLYTTAVCNLNCNYCYIDKNPALVEIDKILDESFKGTYYFDFAKEMFPDPLQLKRVETWGGEPFLRMDRLYETMHYLIPHYPNLSSFFSSTNFCFDEWLDQFYGLLKQFERYPDRIFSYDLQMSLDGPEWITDKNRGKGTTAGCLANFEKLAQTIGNNLPSNVTLTMFFKPTLDVDTLQELSSRSKIIEYYQFLDNLVLKVKQLGFSNVIMNPSVPNLACPSPVLKEDGEFFAKVCQMCRQIEADNADHSIFQCYETITPFWYGNEGETSLTFRHSNFTCGTGYTVLGLLPNKRVSACHNGFVDLISEYKKLSTGNHGNSTINFNIFMDDYISRLTSTKEGYEQYEAQMSCYNCPGTSARLANIVSVIHSLAQAGQIESRYKDLDEALKAAIFYQSHTSYCVRDNMSVNGSLTLIPVGMIKLLFNGAHKYLGGKEVWTD